MKTKYLWFGLGLALLAGCVGPSRPAVLAAAGIKDSVNFPIYDLFEKWIAGLPVLSSQGKAQVGSLGGGLVSLGDAYLLMFPGTVAPGSSAQIEELSLADLPAPLPPYFEPVAVYRVRVERLAYSVPATDWGIIVNIPTPFESLPPQAKAVLAAHPAPKDQNLDQDAMLKYVLNVESSLSDISYTQRLLRFKPADGEYTGATRGPVSDEKGRLFMPHFIDSSWVHEEDHDQIDWIYVAVQADEREIIAACTESGGYWNGAYCSCGEPGMTTGAFEHCYPDPSYQGEPDSRRYENDFDIMTHNVGNSSGYCAGYGYKLCSVVTETRLRKEVIENFGSYPDILVFQEMWNDDCEGVSGLYTSLADYVCHANNRDVSQRKRVFQHEDLVQKYVYGCSPRARGGYECTATLKDGKFAWDNPYPELEQAFDQPPSCSDKLTGVFSVRLKFDNSGSGRFHVLNTHLASPATLGGNVNCRVEQLEAAFGHGIDRAMVAGDFNIDVSKSGSLDEDEKALRNYLNLDGNSGYEYRLYSNPEMSTHYAAGSYHTYDLVFEADKNADGNFELLPIPAASNACSVNGELDGFDHRAVRCQARLVLQ